MKLLKAVPLICALVFCLSAGTAQAKADIASHIQMREQGEILKHHADPPRFRRQAEFCGADRFTLQHNLPGA